MVFLFLTPTFESVNLFHNWDQESSGRCNNYWRWKKSLGTPHRGPLKAFSEHRGWCSPPTSHNSTKAGESFPPSKTKQLQSQHSPTHRINTIHDCGVGGVLLILKKEPYNCWVALNLPGTPGNEYMKSFSPSCNFNLMKPIEAVLTL